MQNRYLPKCIRQLLLYLPINAVKVMFDDIRPYNDSEISAAMHRIARDPLFPVLADFVFPGRELADVKNLVESIATIDDFQKKIMYFANNNIISRSIADFTYSGVENVRPDTRYLFVSNHRDIMLDASLLQTVLVNNGLQTTEITFGANLMQHPLVVDIGRSNKMFKVERPGSNMREFYRSSTHLSDYIRTTLLDKGNSIWIAQRNGRTKDGMDRTDVGVIKMFSMSRSDDPVKSISELNIIPVSISYEWEPCDKAKAVELWQRMQGPYTKRPGEDVESILSGILAPKGRVHIHICEPLSPEELAGAYKQSVNAFHKGVAGMLDKRICSAYRLFPNNYLAHDILHGSERYRDFYTPADVERFQSRMNGLFPGEAHDSELCRIFLGIYANPVDSKEL